jgi:hypothetical protein
MERRQRTRVDVRLQCRVSQPGKPAVHLCNETENISRTGILIRWCQNKVPAVGEQVTIKLRMPPNPVFGQRWMVFRANVVRVSRSHEQGLMVAVAGSPVRFSSAPKAMMVQPAGRYVNYAGRGRAGRHDRGLRRPRGRSAKIPPEFPLPEFQRELTPAVRAAMLRNTHTLRAESKNQCRF